MKTNQNMIRKMNAFDVTQRTRDGFFNATLLISQWNEAVKAHKKLFSNSADNQAVLIGGNSPHLGNPSIHGTLSQKEIKDYLFNNSTKDFIQTIIDKENLTSENDVCKTARGKYGGTWMHPMLFIDFAMWLNPSFKYDVIRFVYDKMILYRTNACDAYKELSSAVASIVDKSFISQAMQRVSKGMNYIVFDEHQIGARNLYGSEEKQEELWLLEKKVADLINEGFITTFDGLIAYLRKLWKDKNVPKVLKTD